jgi:hypothetical protein
MICWYGLKCFVMEVYSLWMFRHGEFILFSPKHLDILE